MTTMTRQQSRQEARQQAKLDAKIKAACKTNPMMQAAYTAGYNEGSQFAVRCTIKDCYAAALLAIRKLEGYGEKRGKRFLREIDDIVVNRLTTEDLMDEALASVGVRINFREPFDRVEEVV